MSIITANAQGSAAVQAPLWNQRARDWAELQEPGQRRLFETVLEKLNVGPRTVHLDVGCGAGMAIQLSARRGAQIYGLDAAAALIEIARERTPNADLRVGEMEALPYENEEIMLRGMLSGGPAARAIEHSSESTVREAIRTALKPFRTSTNGYRLENKFRYLVTAR